MPVTPFVALDGFPASPYSSGRPARSGPTFVRRPDRAGRPPPTFPLRLRLSEMLGARLATRGRRLFSHNVDPGRLPFSRRMHARRRKDEGQSKTRFRLSGAEAQPVLHSNHLARGTLSAWSEYLFMGFDTLALPGNFPSPSFLLPALLGSGDVVKVAGYREQLLRSISSL